MATKQANKDPLDALAAAGPERIIALILWQDRQRNPDLYRMLTEKDIKGFDDCVGYLKVTPQVKIHRPQGIPSQPAIPAQGNRRAVQGREATPPKPYVMVVLTDQKGDAIRPVENNQEDFDAAKSAEEIRRMREQAPRLAQLLMQQARSGEFSLSVMQDCADALMTLARAA